jgi:hypothetical protein
MGRFLQKLIGAPDVIPVLNDDHFTLDGTLLQDWETHLAGADRGVELSATTAFICWRVCCCFKALQEEGERVFPRHHAQQTTHRSTVDPDALLSLTSNAYPGLPSGRGHVM